MVEPIRELPSAEQWLRDPKWQAQFDLNGATDLVQEVMHGRYKIPSYEQSDDIIEVAPLRELYQHSTPEVMGETLRIAQGQWKILEYSIDQLSGSGADAREASLQLRAATDAMRWLSIWMPIWQSHELAPKLTQELTNRTVDLAFTRSHAHENSDKYRIDHLTRIFSLNFLQYGSLLPPHRRKEVFLKLLELAPLSSMPSLPYELVSEVIEAEVSELETLMDRKMTAEERHRHPEIPNPKDCLTVEQMKLTTEIKPLMHGCEEAEGLHLEAGMDTDKSVALTYQGQLLGGLKTGKGELTLVAFQNAERDRHVLVQRGGLYAIDSRIIGKIKPGPILEVADVPELLRWMPMRRLNLKPEQMDALQSSYQSRL